MQRRRLECKLQWTETDHTNFESLTLQQEAKRIKKGIRGLSEQIGMLQDRKADLEALLVQKRQEAGDSAPGQFQNLDVVEQQGQFESDEDGDC